MKFWSILIQISVTNFVLPTSSEVTPSNSTHFDRLENLLDAVDSKVERDDYYEDDYGLVFINKGLYPLSIRFNQSALEFVASKNTSDAHADTLIPPLIEKVVLFSPKYF